MKNWLTKEFFIDLLRTDVEKWNELTAKLTKINLNGAKLNHANLNHANLDGAKLNDAELNYAELNHANLNGAKLNGAKLNYANLIGAKLNGAKLNDAELNHANLDFSVWPLWCGSFDVKVDKKIAAQLIYHICKLDCNDAEFLKIRNNTDLIAFANEFHRVGECGEIEELK